MADVDELLSGSGSEDEEQMTAAEVLQIIEELWINEKVSPVLENHRAELVECMLDQINQMSKNLKRCSNTELKLSVHKMEIDRIRYVLCSYLRIRIKKIEKYVHHLLKTNNTIDEDSKILSREELQYAIEFASNLDGHFNSLVLKHVPENMQEFNVNKMTVQPNLDSYVFFKVKEDSPGVLLEDNTGEGRDEEIDLHKEGQHLMRYRAISHLIESGTIKLI